MDSLAWSRICLYSRRLAAHARLPHGIWLDGKVFAEFYPLPTGRRIHRRPGSAPRAAIMSTVHLDNRPASSRPPEGELYAALCLAFAGRLADIKINCFGTGDCYTHLSLRGRSAQVFTGLGSQGFRLDFSEAGSMVAKGQTLAFDQAVAALTTWLGRTGTVEDLIAQHPPCEIHRPQDFAA